ncbi:MAG TPA: MYXO-CTERM sorting domain-containing protein [Polyangiales bacterium]|nr:MYXO-CTERM sorting domain-containing protein [Polyangiales bacterium]
MSLLIVLSGGYATRAAAHATPHVLEMVFPESGYVLVSNRGLIFGDAERANWQLMCAEALHINTSERPSVVSVSNGALLVGTSMGLSRTNDRGCHWEGVEPFAETSVPALIHDPASPQRLYLAAYSNQPDGKGGVYVSEDAGKTWQKLMPADERDYVGTIRLAPGDAKRIYASGQTWDGSGKYSFYIASSSDAGKTWQRTPVQLTEEELEVTLFAVHPKNPELITARAGGRSPMSIPERLLVSRDAGKTWSSPLAITLLSSVAFSADGSKTWVAGGDGLFESTDDLATFKRLGDATSMSYVTEREGQLLVAGYYTGLGSGDNGIGEMRAPDRYDSFMQLTDVKAPVACDASSPTAQTCAPWWMDWQRELLDGQFAGDAGMPVGTAGASGAVAASGTGGSAAGGSAAAGMGAAGSAAGAAAGSTAGTSAAGSSGGGGCSAGGTPRSAGAWLLLAAAALFERRRRR